MPTENALGLRRWGEHGPASQPAAAAKQRVGVWPSAAPFKPRIILICLTALIHKHWITPDIHWLNANSRVHSNKSQLRWHEFILKIYVWCCCAAWEREVVQTWGWSFMQWGNVSNWLMYCGRFFLCCRFFVLFMEVGRVWV